MFGLAASQCPKLEIGPPWTYQVAREALQEQESWSNYCFGPSQLIREKLLSLPADLVVIECPICDKFMKADIPKLSSILKQHLDCVLRLIF